MDQIVFKEGLYSGLIESLKSYAEVVDDCFGRTCPNRFGLLSQCPGVTVVHPAAVGRATAFGEVVLHEAAPGVEHEVLVPDRLLQLVIVLRVLGCKKAKYDECQ